MDQSVKLFVLCLAALFIGMQVGIGPVIPLFFTSIGISVTVWGYLAAVSALGMLFFEPLWGWLSDRFGRVIFIAGSLLVGALIVPMYSFTFFVPFFFILQFLRGVFIVMAAPSTRALVSDFSSPEKLGKAMGLLWASLRLGGAIGVIFASYVAENWTSAISFYSCSVIFFVGGVLALFVLKKVKSQNGINTSHIEKEKTSYLQSLKRLSKMKTVLVLFICAIVVLLQTRLITDFIPIYAVQLLGASTVMVGIIQAVFTGLSALLLPICGIISDKVGRKRTRTIILIGFSVCCSATLLYTFTRDIYQLLLITAGVSIGFSLLALSLLALLSNVVPNDVQGATMGLYGGFENLGGMIAPLLYATVWNTFSPSSIFYVCSLTQIFGIILAFALKEKRLG